MWCCRPTTPTLQDLQDLEDELARATRATQEAFLEVEETVTRHETEAKEFKDELERRNKVSQDELERRDKVLRHAMERYHEVDVELDKRSRNAEGQHREAGMTQWGQDILGRAQSDARQRSKEGDKELEQLRERVQKKKKEIELTRKAFLGSLQELELLSESSTEAAQINSLSHLVSSTVNNPMSAAQAGANQEPAEAAAEAAGVKSTLDFSHIQAATIPSQSQSEHKRVIPCSPYLTEAILQERQGLRRSFILAMKKKPAKSWAADKFPVLVESDPFGGGECAKEVLMLAEKHGLLKPIMSAREDVKTSLWSVQLAVCMSAGDSRTGLKISKKRDLSLWKVANKSSAAEYKLAKPVIDAIVGLKQSKGVVNLTRLASELTEREFATIPALTDIDLGAGFPSVVGDILPEINTKPVQLIGFLYLLQDMNNVIALEKWTPAMRREIEAAIATLNSGVFGDPEKIGNEGGGTFRAERERGKDFASWQGPERTPQKKTRDDGRDDFRTIQIVLGADQGGGITWFDPETKGNHMTPTHYLIVLAINRYETFHKCGAIIEKAVPGSKYIAGPIKHKNRIDAKCGLGGDYHSHDQAMSPNCMRVLDVLRGTVTCTSHEMMVHVYAKAVDVFGEEPVVRKDRRMKVQHDMLLVFQVDDLFVELQLHYSQTMNVKLLMHAVFEIQRLNTADFSYGENNAEILAALEELGYEKHTRSVTDTGLHTIMTLPTHRDLATDCKILLHI